MTPIESIHFDNRRYTIRSISPHSKDYDTVMLIRSQGIAGVYADEYDETADIYLLMDNSIPIATMRVNQARRGKMDCEAFYPGHLLRSHRHLIASSSRLARSITAKPNVYLMRQFMRTVWRQQVIDGIRIDLINAHQRMLPYYVDLGYRLMCNSFFVHPRIHTPSHVMFMVASSETPSAFAEVFAPPDDPLLQELSAAEIPVCWNNACFTSAAERVKSCPRLVCQCKAAIA